LRRVIAEPRAVIGGAIMLSVLFVALAAPYLAPHDPAEQDLLRTLLPPAWLRGGDWAFPLGTDSLGRCTLSQLLFGARVAMTVAVAAAAGASLVGSSLALIGGYFGGAIDWLISRAVDVWMSFPPVVLSLIFMVGFGASCAARSSPLQGETTCPRRGSSASVICRSS
jgi:peptide/nickel transport system permease protein